MRRGLSFAWPPLFVLCERRLGGEEQESAEFVPLRVAHAPGHTPEAVFDLLLHMRIRRAGLFRGPYVEGALVLRVCAALNEARSASFVTVFAMTLLSRLSRFVTSSCVSSPWSQTIRMTTACAAVRSYCSQPSLSQMCDFLYNIDIALNGSSTIPATALASLPAYYTSIWWQLPPFITLISKEF